MGRPGRPRATGVVVAPDRGRMHCNCGLQADLHDRIQSTPHPVGRHRSCRTLLHQDSPAYTAGNAWRLKGSVGREYGWTFPSRTGASRTGLGLPRWNGRFVSSQVERGSPEWILQPLAWIWQRISLPYARWLLRGQMRAAQNCAPRISAEKRAAAPGTRQGYAMDVHRRCRGTARSCTRLAWVAD